VVVTMVESDIGDTVVVDNADSACHELDHIHYSLEKMEMGNHTRKPEEMDNHENVPLFGWYKLADS